MMNPLRALLDERATTDAVFAADPAGTRRVGYPGLPRLADDWRAWAERSGLPDGAPIGCQIADPVDFAAGYVALLAAGRRVVPMDPAAPEEVVRRTCRAAGTRLIVTDRDNDTAVGTGRDVGPARGTHRGGVAAPRTDDTTADGPVRLRMGAHATPPAVPAAPPRSGGGTAGALLFSSGTTGTPKGIALGLDQLLCGADNVRDALRLTAADRCFCPLPTQHINAQVVAVLATLTAGAGVVLVRGFHRTGFWESVRASGATWINAVPAIVAILADDPEPTIGAPGVRLIRTGSAPLPPAVVRRFERRFAIPAIETYGMTEAASQITANPVSGPRRPGSAGLPVGVELRVRRADGTDCLPDELGRVHIRGRSVVREYLGGAYPQRFDADGWLDTGDLGRLDEAGRLLLAGRADDVINRGGQKILPRTVEDVLRTDDAVADVAVVGRPDPVLGEVPVALVAAEPDTGPVDALTARLLARCAERLARHQIPELQWVPRIPRGATGKAARADLLALVGTPDLLSDEHPVAHPGPR